ncbi:MAG TPA: CDP-alcohol phosphatidyltransferase family protein [Mycobacteriales bacterium]|nr:CDP-alcohol phosphatidyltransferase family protein [Mycobacteriales bacterium]
MDSPRPAGRRWRRGLRRSGTFARRVLVGRRAGQAGVTAVVEPVTAPTATDADSGHFVATRPHPAPTTVRPPAGWTPPVASPDGFAVPLLTGPLTPARRLRFALVNACTIASLLLGMSAIFLAFGGHVRVAAFALVGCVVFDGLDGSLARKLGVSTPFGAQMDSLADMCSFGIATPVVAYTWLSGDAPDLLVGASCALVAVCAALRLARFNVSPKNGNYFCGVPTTIAAAIMALSVVLNPAPGPWPVLLVGALALLMVSTFPYVKLSRILRLPAWVWLVPMAGAMIDVPGTFTLGVALYLASGPILWVRERGAVATV